MTGIKVAIINKSRKKRRWAVTKRLTKLLAQSDNTIDQEEPRIVLFPVGEAEALLCI